MSGKIVRYEFLGSYVYVCIAFLLVVTIPLAVIHIITATVRIDEQLENPSEFLAQHKEKHRQRTLP
jgi:ABC-type molybdate transport system permease subunit